MKYSDYKLIPVLFLMCIKHYMHKGMTVLDKTVPSCFAISNDVTPTGRMVAEDLILKHMNLWYIYNIIQNAPKIYTVFLHNIP